MKGGEQAALTNLCAILVVPTGATSPAPDVALRQLTLAYGLPLIRTRSDVQAAGRAILEGTQPAFDRWSPFVLRLGADRRGNGNGARFFVVAGFMWEMPDTLLDDAALPVHVTIALIVYAAVLLGAGAHPRLWRDPVRFGAYAAQWRSKAGEDGGLASDDELRAVSWFDAGVAVAQQSGFVAGGAAGAALLDRGFAIALVGFTVVGFVVGIAVRRWMLTRQRTELEPLLTRLENEDHPASLGQPHAGGA